MTGTAPTRRATPACRRRYSALSRFLAAAVLAAAVLSAGCTPRSENPQIVINPVESSDRTRIGNPSRLSAGTFIKIYGDAEQRASDRSIEEELLWLAERRKVDITDARRAAAKRIAEIQSRRSVDELAWGLAAALEATLSQIIQIGFVRAIDRKNPDFVGALTDMSSSYHAAPDRITTKPLGFAITVQRLAMHSAAEMFERFPPPSELAGSYEVATSGVCAVAAGRYELVQRDRVFELVGDGRIAMYGTIGATKAFFVPNDQRYATITRRNGKPVELRYPDKNAAIMPAQLEKRDNALVIDNRPRSDCVIMLKAIGIGS